MCFPHGDTLRNSVKAICAVSFKATVNTTGFVHLTPLSTATFLSIEYSSGITRKLPCQHLNASGVLKSGSTTAATVQLWEWEGEPPSTLTKHASTITLRTALLGYPKSTCSFNYSVVSGCFFGIKAPATPPACPAKHFLAKGLGGTKYCALCPPGTTSPGPSSKSCTPCPPGTFNQHYGNKCTPCEQGYFAPRPGSTTCEQCIAPYYDGSNKWTDGKKCGTCPSGSYASATNVKQCHKCKAGVKCCTVNPSKDCPPCARGFNPGGRYTSVFALSSGSSTACQASNWALCTPQFSVTVAPSCHIWIRPMPRGPMPRPYPGVFCDWSATAYIRGKSASAAVDLASVRQVPGGPLPMAAAGCCCLTLLACAVTTCFWL